MIWPFSNTKNKPLANKLLVFNLRDKAGYCDAKSMQDADLAAIPIETIFLDLENASITDEGIALLPNLPNLRCIDLDSTNISNQSLIELCRFTKLEEVWLEETNISDEGLAHLAKLDNLIFISVSYCNLSKQGELYT